MPKVLRIINRFNVGGPIYNATYLSKYLEPDFETFLIGGPAGPNEESSLYIPEKLGIKIEVIPEMSRAIGIKNDWIAYKKIKKIIREFKPDIVHTHASKAGFLGRMAAHQLKVPVIVHTFHGNVFDAYFSRIKSKIFQCIERYLARKTDAIIAISSNQKNDLSTVYKICNADKITMIPLGFDLNKFNENKEEKRSEFRKKYSIATDEIVITIVGRLVPVKNHELFFDAIDFVRKHSAKKLRIFVVGDGEQKALLIKYCTEKELPFCDVLKSDPDSLVTFTSWIKEVDVVYCGSDIVALSSLNEGTPVSLIEAQAAGKPIVTTKVGGVENVVLHGKTGFISKINQPEEFYDNLLTLVEDEKLRQLFSEKGWDFVKERFHYLRLVSDMKTLYLTLINTKKVR
jgi:glycosyltransferase involved in cell wall biosynthesis